MVDNNRSSDAMVVMHCRSLCGANASKIQLTINAIWNWKGTAIQRLINIIPEPNDLCFIPNTISHKLPYHCTRICQKQYRRALIELPKFRRKQEEKFPRKWLKARKLNTGYATSLLEDRRLVMRRLS